MEVVRPLDNGTSMEISVTVNNNTQIPGFENTQLSRFDHNKSQQSAFDPSQYSLKSQSYDRGHVDVVVTSESEDYLTLSEDEYSRTGRLANIPEAEAHKLFSGNGVKLAYQKPISVIDEVSSEQDTVTETETDTESFGQKARNIGLESSDKEVDIVDLNVDSSPYHIPKRTNRTDGTEKDRSEITFKNASVKVPVSDLDSVSFGSSNSPRLIPSSDLDRISVNSEDSSQISPRVSVNNNTTFVPNSVNTNNSKESNSSSLTTPYSHPRQQVPVSEIDSIGVDPSLCIQSTDSGHSRSPEFEEVGFEGEDFYNSGSSSGIVGIEFPESHVYISDNGNLYPEEGYELSDSEKDYKPVSDSDDEIGTALPPPVEFSDSSYQRETTLNNNKILIIPVTNIDDFTDDSSSVEASPSNQEIEFVSSDQEYPEAELAKLEASLRELDEASSDKPNSGANLGSVDADLDILHDSCLPLNYEVTINHQRVPHRQENFHTGDIKGEDFETVETSRLPTDYEVTINHKVAPHKSDSVHQISSDFHDLDEVLQVVQEPDEGKVVITQCVPVEKRYSPLSFHENYYNNNSTMDRSSEAMLKNALDMEYDMMPDSEKFQSRIILADSVQSGETETETDLDDPSYLNQNIVAECLAQEMVKSEQNNNGYYMESDDEPDHIPDMDLPENPPDLPDIPPPIMQSSGDNNGYIFTSTPGLSVKLIPAQSLSYSEENAKQNAHSGSAEKDLNWSFRVKDLVQNTEENIEQEVQPQEIEQQSVVRAQLSSPKHMIRTTYTDSDVIVPVKVDRKPKLPESALICTEVTEINAPKPEVIIEPKATVTVHSIKPKVPPVVAPKPSPKAAPAVAPKPSPRKSTDNKSLGKNIGVVQMTHEDDYHDKRPVDEPIVEPSIAMKDKNKSVLNVIKVVNALAEVKSPESTAIELGFSNKVKNSIENKSEWQSFPPKQDTIVTDKQMIKKPKKDNVSVTQSDKDSEAKKQKETEGGKIDVENSKLVATFKTQINLTKEPVANEATEIEEERMNEIKVNKISNEPDFSKVVPRLNLGSVGSSDSSSLSPKSDKSDEKSHEKVVDPSQEKTHKTTIGVSKLETTNEDVTPVSEVKQLSQIKPLSFNPKSLSAVRPVQYKTTINTLGSKPSGISTLGRSSLLNKQTAEHPIKRMETLPFEVSILKGILGIGIKTKMTPEGLVQITEILPSGPVGREGNIK